jgi:hypothetical protein
MFGAVLLAICYVCTTMCMVYKSVSDIEKKARRYSFQGYISPRSKNANHRRRSRRVMIQGILYGLSLFLIYIFPIINLVLTQIPLGYSISVKTWYILQLLQYTFWPLQGFFNALIYSIPDFQRINNRWREKRRSEREMKDICIRLYSNLDLDDYKNETSPLSNPHNQHRCQLISLELGKKVQKERKSEISKEEEEKEEEIQTRSEIAAKALHLEIIRDQLRFNNIIDNNNNDNNDDNEHLHNGYNTNIDSGIDVSAGVSVDDSVEGIKEKANQRLELETSHRSSGSSMIKQYQSIEDFESNIVDNDEILRDSQVYIDDYLALAFR